MKKPKIKYFVLFAFAFVMSSFTYTPVIHARLMTLEEAGLTADKVKSLSKQELNDLLTVKPVQEQIQGILNGQGVKGLVPGFGLNSSSIISTSTVNCFNYYHFGSVSANFGSLTSLTVSGMPIIFSGTVKNDNAYPLVNGSLYVKIFKDRNSSDKDPNGPDVVDQFFVSKDIVIPSNGSVPFTFTWNIPSYIETGNYKAALFFVIDNKFNLMGLSFTDDVIGYSFSFDVRGQKESVRFDKASVKVGNLPFYFAAYPPRVSATGTISIGADILNTTKQKQKIDVSWELYAWDALRPESLLSQKSNQVEVPANGKIRVSFDVTDTSVPVYYLVGKMKYLDTTSIIGVRMVRDGINKIRLNFPAITDYPLIQGKETTVFSCLHGMGTAPVVPNGKLTLSLTDSSGNIIHEYEYTGFVTGEMMGVKDTFIPTKSYDNFTLTANLYQEGKLVDSSVLNYDCSRIDPSSCKSQSLISPTIMLIILLTVLIVLIIIALIVFEKRKNMKNMMIVLIVLSVISGMLLFGGKKAEAKEIDWISTLYGNLYDQWMGNGVISGWLINPNITVKYFSKITNVDTGQEVLDGSNVSVGTHLNVSFVPHDYKDVSWNGTGYAVDTPYGGWTIGAIKPNSFSNNWFTPDPHDQSRPDLYGGCLSDYWVDYFYNNLIPYVDPWGSYYVALMVNPPTKTINTSGLQCDPISEPPNWYTGGKMNCIVNSSGPINVNFNFGQTFGKFYEKWWLAGYGGYYSGGCYGANVPLSADGTTPYQVVIPSQSIVYNLTGINSNPGNLNFKLTPGPDVTVTKGTGRTNGNVISTLLSGSPTGSYFFKGWLSNATVSDIPGFSIGLISSDNSPTVSGKTINITLNGLNNLDIGTYTVHIAQSPTTDGLLNPCNTGSGLTLSRCTTFNLIVTDGTNTTPTPTPTPTPTSLPFTVSLQVSSDGSMFNSGPLNFTSLTPTHNVYLKFKLNVTDSTSNYNCALQSMDSSGNVNLLMSQINSSMIYDGTYIVSQNATVNGNTITYMYKCARNFVTGVLPQESNVTVTINLVPQLSIGDLNLLIPQDSKTTGASQLTIVSNVINQTVKNIIGTVNGSIMDSSGNSKYSASNYSIEVKFNYSSCVTSEPFSTMYDCPSNGIPQILVNLPDNYPRAFDTQFVVDVDGIISTPVGDQRKTTGNTLNGVKMDGKILVTVKAASIKLKVHTSVNENINSGKDTITISTGQKAYVSWYSLLDSPSGSDYYCTKGASGGSVIDSIWSLTNWDKTKQITSTLLGTLPAGTYTLYIQCRDKSTRSLIISSNSVTIKVNSSSFREF
jgi:hypothetical protein